MVCTDGIDDEDDTDKNDSDEDAVDNSEGYKVGEYELGMELT